MDLSVIENDPKEVKKYLQNFVPINYYKVLDDAYLHQIRAVLLHSVSHAELYNPVYAGLINDLTVTVGKNHATINTKLEVQADQFSALARKTETVRAAAANANASITEIQEASASQNKAQASVNQRLEASLDDIVVGGRNIMKNSDFSKGYRVWQDASITKHDHFIGTMHKISSTGIVGSLMGIYPLVKYQNMAMVEGTQYSISFYAYGSILLMDEIYLTSASEAPIKLPSVVISTDLSERRHITFKAPTGGGGLGLIFGATVTKKGDWFSISRIKVELGNKPSDWTPAPEDVEGYINEVQSSIDTFKDVQVERNLATAQTIEKLDSRVKGNAATILEEKKTRVDQFSALSEVTTELTSKTKENEAVIKTVDKTFTDRYNSSASRLEVLEAENSLGKGKITNLESVTTTLGEVVVSQGSTLNAKINNLTMGGRNLLRNSDFKLGVDTWGTSKITHDKSIVGNLTKVTNKGTTTDYFGLTPVNVFKTVTLIKDKEYVLSFYAKGNIPSINDIWITTEGELPQQLESVAITDGISDRYSTVFTANHTTEVGSIIIGASGYAKDKWFAVAAVKLEVGNKATDWTEAPEDSKAIIHDVEANINEFKEVQVKYNEAKAKQLLDLTAKTDNNNAQLVELREVTSNVEGSTAALETKLRSEYVKAISTTKSDITKTTDGKINAVKKTISELSVDISSKADITRVDNVENNAKHSLASAKTEITSNYNSAITTVKSESATDATNKANKAKSDAKTYTDGKVITLTTLVNSKANISRVDEIENNAKQSIAQAKSELTSEYTSAIIETKDASALDAKNKADKALEDANSNTVTKASEAQAAAEVYALAKAKAEADKALADAKGDATSKANAAKSAAIASAALDAKKKADKALADAKLDATTKAEAAKKYAKGLVDTLTVIVNSKADITRVDKVVNDSTQALAEAKVELKGDYSTEITKLTVKSSQDAQAKADKALEDATVKATEAQTAAEVYALAQANAKAASALDSAKSDATTKANKAKADAELAAALDAKKKADEALRLAKLDATAKVDAVKKTVDALTKVVDSKASITRVDSIENNATQALATAKTELTGSYTTAIATAKNQSADDAKVKADAALVAAKKDAQDKATVAKTAAETYALAQAKAKADAALVTADSNAQTKANAAKSAAIAAAALDAKNKADAALTSAKADATTKADAAAKLAKEYADKQISVLSKVVDSKATVTSVEKVVNDANQALAAVEDKVTSAYSKAIEDVTDYLDSEVSKLNTTVDSKADINTVSKAVSDANKSLAELKTTLTGDYTKAIGTAKTASALDAKSKADKVLADAKTDATTKANAAKDAAAAYTKLEAKAKADAALVLASDDATAKANAAKSAAELAAAKDAKTKADKALTDAKADATTKASAAEKAAKAYADTKAKGLTTLISSKADIKQLNTVKNDAEKALASTKTELTGSYTTAIANIEIGGRNLLINTEYNKKVEAYNSTVTVIEGKPNEALVESKGASTLGIITDRKTKIEAQTVYTLSFEVKTNTMTRLGYNYLMDSDESNSSIVPSFSVIADGEWHRYVDTFNSYNVGRTDCGLLIGNNSASADGSFYIRKLKLEKGNKATDWTPAPEDVTDYVDSSVSNLKTVVDSKANISRVDTVENNATKALATAKTDLTGSYTKAIATAKSQSATDAQTRATKALTDAKADTVLKANAAQSAAKTYALAEAKAKADAALLTAKSDATTKANAAKSAAEATAALDAKKKADKALADAKLDAKAKADEALKLAKAHADSKVSDLTKIVNSKANISSLEKVENTASKAIASLKTDLTASYSITDTRGTNETPAWYQTNYSKQLVREFKTSKVIGIPGSGYTYLETTVKYVDASGGNVTQQATTDGGTVYNRSGTGKTWSAWVEQEDTKGSAAKVAALKSALDKDVKAVDARVTVEKKVAATATSAVASTLSKLSTTVNGNTSSIKETKTSLNGISAKWAMETNVNGKVSGIYQHSTGKRSGLDIITDKFSVSDGTTSSKPFVIEGGVVKVGVPLVSESLITAPIITGGTMMAGTFQGGQIAIGSETVTNKGVISKANFKVTSDGVVTAKAGRFEGTVLANKIEGKVANIADLAVDTLQIRGQAVSVLIADEIPTPKDKFAKYKIVQSMAQGHNDIKTLNSSKMDSSGSIVIIEVSFLEVSTGNQGRVYLEFAVNGSVKKSIPLPTSMSSPSATFRVYVQGVKGEATYQVSARSVNWAGLWSPNVIVTLTTLKR